MIRNCLLTGTLILSTLSTPIFAQSNLEPLEPALAELKPNSLCNTVNCAQKMDVLASVLASGNLSSKFVVETGCTVANNNMEDESYESSQIMVKKDRLTIIARKNKDKVLNPGCWSNNAYFKSGRINTSDHFIFSREDGTKNGKPILKGGVEVTAAVPYGKGLWPAIWMLPLNSFWPTGMEIDIAEFQSFTPQEGAPLGSHVHYGFNDGKKHPNPPPPVLTWNFNGNGADKLFMFKVYDSNNLTPTILHNYGFTWNCVGYKKACDLTWYLDGTWYLTMHLDPPLIPSHPGLYSGNKPSILEDKEGHESKFVAQPNPPIWAARPTDPTVEAMLAFNSLWYGLDHGYFLILNIAVGGTGLATDNQPVWDTFTDATMDVFNIQRYILQ